MKSGTVPTPYARIVTLLRSPCSLNFPNLCDNFVKKLVSEIRKWHQLQGGFVPLTPDQGLCPWIPLGPLPPNPHYIIWPPLSRRSGSTLTEISRSLSIPLPVSFLKTYFYSQGLRTGS